MTTCIYARMHAYAVHIVHAYAHMHIHTHTSMHVQPSMHMHMQESTRNAACGDTVHGTHHPTGSTQQAASQRAALDYHRAVADKGSFTMLTCNPNHHLRAVADNGSFTVLTRNPNAGAPGGTKPPPMRRSSSNRALADNASRVPGEWVGGAFAICFSGRAHFSVL